jgi:hypothetical protein
MKRLIPVFVLLLLSITSFAQLATPAGALATPSGMAIRTQLYCTYDTCTDLAGKDSSFISPGSKLIRSTTGETAVVHNFIYVGSAGDSIYSSHTIVLQDTTHNGVLLAGTDNYCAKGDLMVIDYKTNGVGTKDTLFFYGNIEVDTTGSGSNKALYITKDATMLEGQILFYFNGSKWIEQCFRRSGNRIGR